MYRIYLSPNRYILLLSIFFCFSSTPQSAIDRAAGRSPVRRGRDHYGRPSNHRRSSAGLDRAKCIGEPVFGNGSFHIRRPKERKKERYKHIDGKSIEKSSLNRLWYNNIESPHRSLIARPATNVMEKRSGEKTVKRIVAWTIGLSVVGAPIVPPTLLPPPRHHHGRRARPSRRTNLYTKFVPVNGIPSSTSDRFLFCSLTTTDICVQFVVISSSFKSFSREQKLHRSHQRTCVRVVFAKERAKSAKNVYQPKFHWIASQSTASGWRRRRLCRQQLGGRFPNQPGVPSSHQTHSSNKLNN